LAHLCLASAPEGHRPLNSSLGSPEVAEPRGRIGPVPEYSLCVSQKTLIVKGKSVQYDGTGAGERPHGQLKATPERARRSPALSFENAAPTPRNPRSGHGRWSTSGSAPTPLPPSRTVQPAGPQLGHGRRQPALQLRRRGPEDKLRSKPGSKPTSSRPSRAEAQFSQSCSSNLPSR
jgi:hypothetical protein